MYKCEHFDVHEWVYPELYKKYLVNKKPDMKLWSVIDERVLITADRVREFVNIPVSINDWINGGNFKESGLREPSTSTGADLSQHKFGRAGDLKFNSSKWNPELLRQYMKSIGCFEPGFRYRTDAEAKPFVFIHRVEWRRTTPMSWFHYDVSPLYSDDGSILIIWIN